jgi:hypothetical protein
VPAVCAFPSKNSRAAPPAQGRRLACLSSSPPRLLLQ